MRKTVLPVHQARSRESLARLLEAALEVLDKHGIEGATIPRIAARAGLSPGAVYRRFRDKDALLREVCFRMLEDNYRRTSEALAAEHWKDQSLAEILRSVIDLTLKAQRKHRGRLRALLFFMLQHPDPVFVRKSTELQTRAFQNVAAMLLTRRDEIGHPDPEAAVRFAMLMIGLAAQGTIILPHTPSALSHLLPDIDRKVERELPHMILQFLGVKAEP